jgi:uncharacterized protein YceK
MITGFLVLCLMTCLFMSGCMSRQQENAPEQPAAQQPTITISQPAGAGGPQGTPAAEGTPAAGDQGLVSDDSGDTTLQAGALDSARETNLTSDSPDLGDIMP